MRNRIERKPSALGSRKKKGNEGEEGKKPAEPREKHNMITPDQRQRERGIT